MNTADTLDHWAGPAYNPRRSKRLRPRWRYGDRAMAKLRRSYG